MGQYTSYYLYQKYETRGSQEAIPVYPNVYSIDADGTREMVIKLDNDPECGYDPPTPPIYKWVNIPITQDYVCDDCPEYQTRWVRTDDTICSGTPTPVSKKLVANYSDGRTLEVECNSSTELTTGETKPSGYDYSKMRTAVIGQCVTSIDYNAFDNCSGLLSINIPNSVTSIKNGAFYNCSSLTSVTIPNSVTTISSNAFSHCGSLTSVNIPGGVTRIGRGAFEYCSGLTSVTIPNSVTTIGELAFEYCSGLASVTIPDSVTSVGDWAFAYCTGLTSITCLATTPPSLGIYTFYEATNFPIYVPSQSVSAYKSADRWSTLASRIQPIT